MKVTGFAVEHPKKEQLPPGVDWQRPSRDELPAALAAVEEGWIFLLGPQEYIPLDDLTRLLHAVKMVEARNVDIGQALAVRVLLDKGDSILEEVQPRFWRAQAHLSLDAAGCLQQAGVPLRRTMQVEDVRIDRLRDAPNLFNVPPSTTHNLTFPDPLPAAQAVLDTPLDFTPWLELLHTAAGGLGVAALGLIQGYPYSPPPDLINRVARILRSLATADLLGPADMVYGLADNLQALTSAVAPPVIRVQGLQDLGQAVSTPQMPNKPEVSQGAVAGLADVLGKACFVSDPSPGAQGYARGLKRHGLLELSEDLVARTLLALGQPVLFLYFDETVSRLGSAHPGLVHVLWLPCWGDPTLTLLTAHSAGSIRLWRTSDSSLLLPSVTELPLRWLPSEAQLAAKPAVPEDAVFVLGNRDNAAMAITYALCSDVRIIYFPMPVPDYLPAAVTAASQGRTTLLPVSVRNEAEAFAYMQLAAVFETESLRWKNLRATVCMPDNPRPVEVNKARHLLHRAGFALPPGKLSGAPREASVLLIADVKGWSFDINLDVIEQILQSQGVHVSRWYAGEGDSAAPPAGHDVYYASYMTPSVWGLPPERLLGSLRTQWFRPENPGSPNAEEWAYLRRCAGFAVPNMAAFKAFRAFGADERLVYLSNPVDMARFPTRSAVPGVIAAWAGNTGHRTDPRGDAKGLFTIIEPACARAEVPLTITEYSTRLPSELMGTFYCGASVYLCASAHEGASNSAMEALACGLLLISTDVGNVREIRDSQLANYGTTGIFLVERREEAFVEALRHLQTLSPDQRHEMGGVNRAEIQARWSIEAWTDRYLAFFRGVL